MNSFWIGLIIGTTFGLAIAIILSRLAGSLRVVSGLFGFSDEKKKIKDLEWRLAEKDKYIKKAIESFKKEEGVSAPPPEE